MNSRIEQLESQLEGLRSRRDRLATHLEQAAERLENPGERPPEVLLAELTEYRQKFQTAASDLELIDADAIDGPIADLSLDDLELRLAWHRRVQQALSVLSAVGRLRSLDGERADELSVVTDDVEILQQRLVSFPDIDPRLVNELARGTHPLCELLQLATSVDTLSDDAWNAAIDNLRDVYGKPVATSAARGRLSLAPPEQA